MSQVVRVSLSYVYTVSSFKYVYFQKLQRTVSSKEKVPLFANVHLRKSLSTKYRTTNVLVAPKSKKTELVRSFQVSFIITSLTSHQTNSHGTEFLHQCIGDSRVVFPNGCFQPTHLGEGSMEISMGSFAKVPTSCFVFVTLMRIFLVKLVDKTVAIILSQ